MCTIRKYAALYNLTRKNLYLSIHIEQFRKPNKHHQEFRNQNQLNQNNLLKKT